MVPTRDNGFEAQAYERFDSLGRIVTQRIAHGVAREDTFVIGKIDAALGGYGRDCGARLGDEGALADAVGLAVDAARLATTLSLAPSANACAST